MIRPSRHNTREDVTMPSASMDNAEKAFAVIRKYDPKGQLGVGHDVLYAGGEKARPEAMDPSDCAALKRLGWLWDDDFDSWMRFI